MQSSDLLKGIEKLIKPLRDGQERLERDVSLIKQDVTTLKQDVTTLDLKIEAIHHDLKEKLKETSEAIMNALFDSNELNGGEIKKLNKRVDRIEKHVNLPPH